MRVRRVLAVAHLDAGQRGGRAVVCQDVEERQVAVAVVDVVVARLLIESRERFKKRKERKKGEQERVRKREREDEKRRKKRRRLKKKKTRTVSSAACDGWPYHQWTPASFAPSLGLLCCFPLLLLLLPLSLLLRAEEGGR